VAPDNLIADAIRIIHDLIPRQTIGIVGRVSHLAWEHPKSKAPTWGLDYRGVAPIHAMP
jgi:hypothetical protein